MESMHYILQAYDLAAGDLQTSDHLIGSNLDSITINRRLSALIKGTKGAVPTAAVSSNGELIDAWGTPFLFAETNSAFYESLNSDMKHGEHWPFVIWSAGANQANDFGFRDDIIR